MGDEQLRFEGLDLDDLDILVLFLLLDVQKAVLLPKSLELVLNVFAFEDALVENLSKLNVFILHLYHSTLVICLLLVLEHLDDVLRLGQLVEILLQLADIAVHELFDLLLLRVEQL